MDPVPRGCRRATSPGTGEVDGLSRPERARRPRRRVAASPHHFSHLTHQPISRSAMPESESDRPRDDQPTPAEVAKHPEVPGARARAMLGALRRLPQGALSRAFGHLADVPLPRPLRRPVLGGFARMVGADVGEAAQPLESFGSLNRFFVRELKPGARAWPHDPRIAASPVDGATGQLGRVSGGKLIQAKGRSYSLRDLLDEDVQWERFDGGAF